MFFWKEDKYGNFNLQILKWKPDRFLNYQTQVVDAHNLENKQRWELQL
jgi:hypothetical protein